MHPGQPVALRVTCHNPNSIIRMVWLNGWPEQSLIIWKTIAVQKFNENIAPLPQLILVRFFRDTCTISVDTSGELLNRRGYRLETAKAPLRETLAAGLLMASGWDAHSPLMDPFCGSGTIAIEAALMARRIAPGKNRQFAFMNWPEFDEKKWKHQLARSASLEIHSSVPILASDRVPSYSDSLRNAEPPVYLIIFSLNARQFHPFSRPIGQAGS